MQKMSRLIESTDFNLSLSMHLGSILPFRNVLHFEGISRVSLLVESRVVVVSNNILSTRDICLSIVV